MSFKKDDKPTRKMQRLQGFDYNNSRYYFLTICVKDKRCILSTIQPGDVIQPASIRLSDIGNVVNSYIVSSDKIDGITILNYVIMPNHIHVLLQYIGNDGSSRAPTPTNAAIPHYVSTLKRLINRRIGENIWQRGYYDHTIRDENDYRSVWTYIDNNPAHWAEDKYYSTSILRRKK